MPKKPSRPAGGPKPRRAPDYGAVLVRLAVELETQGERLARIEDALTALAARLATLKRED